MKRCIITISFLMAFICHLSAPPNKVMYLLAPEKINYYAPLINAVVTTESNWNQTAYNPKELAMSYFQVRPVRLRDFNKRTGKHYVMADMYNFNRAKEVFMYYCKSRNYETVARGWAGGDAGTRIATNDYWQKVSKHLKTNQ